VFPFRDFLTPPPSLFIYLGFFGYRLPSRYAAWAVECCLSQMFLAFGLQQFSVCGVRFLTAWEGVYFLLEPTHPG
jgi:hypothetical protein